MTTRKQYVKYNLAALSKEITVNASVYVKYKKQSLYKFTAGNYFDECLLLFKSALKSLPKIIFVTTAKISENTTSILNSCFC